MSSRMRHGSWLSRPMTPLRATAAIKLTSMTETESNRDRRAYAGMRLVTLQLKVGQFEAKDVLDRRIQPHSRQSPGLPRELQLGLLAVIVVQVHVPEAVHEVTRREIADLGHHQRQQRVGRDIERDAEKDVRAPLIELAGQLAVRDVELEQAVAGRQRHLLDLADVPGAHDQAPRVWIGLDLANQARDLIDVSPVRSRPGTPLISVHRTELALGVRPLVPDRDVMLVQEAHVGFSPKEPEQLDDDGPQMQLLRGQARKACGQVKPQLMAEEARRARAGPIRLRSPLGHHFPKKIEIRLHVLDYPPSLKIGMGRAAPRSPRHSAYRAASCC